MAHRPDRAHHDSASRGEAFLCRAQKLADLQPKVHWEAELDRLLRRVRDFADVKADGRITREVAMDALAMMDVDVQGFDEIDRRLMMTIIEKYGGGPVGVNALAASIHEDVDAIEDIYEPFLIQIGFIDRTPRGRVATARAYEYFGLQAPRKDSRLW